MDIRDLCGTIRVGASDISIRTQGDKVTETIISEDNSVYVFLALAVLLLICASWFLLDNFISAQKQTGNKKKQGADISFC